MLWKKSYFHRIDLVVTLKATRFVFNFSLLEHGSDLWLLPCLGPSLPATFPPSMALTSLCIPSSEPQRRMHPPYPGIIRPAVFF